MKLNATVAEELNTLSENAAVARREAARLKKEADRFHKLHALTLEKIAEGERKQAEAEARTDELRRRAEELDASVETERRRVDAKRQAVEDVRREKDVLGRTLAAASDKAKEASAAVALQQAVQRNLQTEVTQAAVTMRTLRTEIGRLMEERGRYATQAEEAQRVSAAVVASFPVGLRQEAQRVVLSDVLSIGSACASGADCTASHAALPVARC
jgi:predicted  nucleic acid-binding Zn-ribbon protein